jgi:hypothetical protein
MAGILKVDQVQSDSNLAFNIAGSNVAFMNATSLQMVGSNVSLAGTNVITNGKLVTSAQPVGAILQVVQVSLGGSTVWSSTSATPSDIGLSASITPTSATSKILIIVQLSQVNTNGGNGTGIGFKIVKNGTDIIQFESAAAYSTGTGESDSYVGGAGTSYLDSPASTSALTYKVQGWRTNGSYTCRLHPAGPGNSGITLMEIAA